MVTHRGASGRAISFSLMAWPAPCSWTLPTLCTIEVAALLTFVFEAGIQDCSQWRQSRTPSSLTLRSMTTKHKSLHWACNRHLSMLGLLTVPGLAGKTVPGDFFRRRQGLLPGHSGMK